MSRNTSLINSLAAGLLASGLSLTALAQSVEFPTYTAGPQSNGSFIVGSGAVIKPAGIQVNLGTQVRAKAVALNPLGNHTAAVLTMGANAAVQVFNTQTGAVIQSYTPSLVKKDPDGSDLGITYTPDGKYLIFSQDGSTYYGTFKQGGYVAIASVNPVTGMLSDYAHVSVPMDVNAFLGLTNVTCFNNSPGGTNGSFLIPCGYADSIFGNETVTSYPKGIAVSADLKTAYVVLQNNDTLAKIDLTQNPPVEVGEVRVGQVPHSVIISPDGKTAFVSNEGGRVPISTDSQQYSNGTPVVADPVTGSINNGTVSVIDLPSFTVRATVKVGLHPTGLAIWSEFLLVANAYDDTVQGINLSTLNSPGVYHIYMPTAPGTGKPVWGAGPNSIAVDPLNNIGYVALYNANAIEVLNLANPLNPMLGMIPVGYAPSSVVYDAADDELIVANDKGWGTTGNPNPFETVAGAPLTANSTATEFGVKGLNTHQDLGTVSIIPIPKNHLALEQLTGQVFQNNHWDLAFNQESSAGGTSNTAPVAIPTGIGDPSLIKHVFLIIRENRTYDQILGDVSAGNGDAALATFGDNPTFGSITPNLHSIVQRFPLLDNFYNPSRQSADGHNWIVQAIAPYNDDIQSPDWLNDYPSNGGDAIAYQTKGHLWDTAAAAGVTFKNYGEYIEYNKFNPPTPQGQKPCTPTNVYSGVTLPFLFSGSCEPQWIDFYNDTQAYETGAEKQLYNYNTVSSFSPLPNLINHTIQNYPQFDLGIPDQFRYDIWSQDFANDAANGTVPQLEMIWISSNHTGGPPTAQAMQADSDLALGRFVDAISHSSVWATSAIFIEEDDAQTGVDHVDGHRSDGYVISPFVEQNGFVDSTFYTQVNLTRTIEQILGIPPMNQNDLFASPMSTLFTNNPPAANFKPWSHVPPGLALTTGVTQTPAQPIPAPLFKAEVKPEFVAKAPVNESPAVKALRVGWMKKKNELFADKYQKPDSEDPDTVNHLIWYEATNFVKPFPGEKKVRPASDFKNAAPAKDDDGD